MLAETIIGILCVVAFVLVGWTILLRIKLEELEKKIKALEEFYKTHKKLDSV